jgi:hypothetical protein
MKIDGRGSFTEFIKTENHGQVSINISKPGITKGQHWHNNSVERFLVVSGRGLIQLRKVGCDEKGKKFPVINHYVDASELRVIEMIPGYTHNIVNLSDTEDLVTIISALLEVVPLLPLTEDPKLSWKYGTRHRAALGMSEVSDAACLVVSEETGDVSICMDGMLKKYEDLTTLKSDLESILGVKPAEAQVEKHKNIFDILRGK